jgi:transcriptional regulator with XRE-family HTH domain
MPPKRTLRPRTPRLGSLGQAIEEARRKAELSQEDLAERSGIHPTHISGLERGARNPTYETLAQVGEGLGITVGELATAADDIHRKKRSSSTKRG